MTKLSQSEIRLLLEKMETRYALARNGDKGKVGERHPKTLPDLHQRWRKMAEGDYAFTPLRNSLVEACWKVPEISAYMREHLAKTHDTSFYPHTYEDLHNPRYAPDGTKEVRSPQLKIYLMYAGFESPEALRTAAQAQQPKEAGSLAATPGSRQRLSASRVLLFIAGFVVGILAATLYLQAPPQAPALGDPLEFDAYFLTADSTTAKDSIWDRASFQFRPYVKNPDSFAVVAKNLYINSSIVFAGTASYDTRFLFVRLHQALPEKNTSPVPRHYFFIFDLGSVNNLAYLQDKLVGGNFLSHSRLEKITTGTILLCGKHFPEGKKESARQIIGDYLKALPNARTFSSDFPLKGEPEELLTLIKKYRQ